MYFKIKFSKLLIGLLFFLIFSFTSTITSDQVFARPNANQLRNDIDEFFTQGADAYLVWQYGGDLHDRRIAVDQYSFFRDAHPEICQVLQEKSQQYPDKRLGVNINNIGAAEFEGGVALDHLTYLRQNCGVTLVRVFAKIEGANGVMRALNTANQAGVQMIVAIGDYSNGGGGMPQGANISWYQTGWQGEYRQLALEIVQRINNSSSARNALFAFELANEPHCGGDINAINAYRDWGRDAGNILSGVSGINIGYGQMASQNTTRCDSPGATHEGVSDFVFTNNLPVMNVASAHYYTPEEKSNALLALNQTKSQLNNRYFYIGEAPPGFYEPEPEGRGYNPLLYPFYDFDNNIYYMHPICVDTDDGGRCAETSNFTTLSPAIKSNLFKQGYQVHCAAPDTTIEVEKSGDYARFIEKLASDGNFRGRAPLQIRDVSSQFVADFSNAQSPIFRDISDRRWLMASIEEFFGFKDIYVQDPPQALLNTSPIELLVSSTQKCEMVKDLLQSTFAMCQTLTTAGDNCPLDTPIPDPQSKIGRSFTRLSLNGAIGSISCNDIMSNPQHQDLRHAVLNTPLYLERAYRYAFLVIAIEEVPEDNNRLFNFLRIGAEPATKHSVRAIAFKVPDVGLDHHPEHLQYNDSLHHTRDTLIPWSKREEYVALQKTYKQERLQQAGGVQLLPFNDNHLINCLGKPECSQDPLMRALVDMINGTGDSCSGFTIDPVRSIGDPTTLTDGQSRELVDDRGLTPAQAASDLFIDRTDPQQASFNFLTHFNVERLNQGGETTVRTFLIYPGDTDIQQTSEVLAGTFFTRSQIDALYNSPQKKDKFPFLRGILSFLGGSDGRTYSDQCRMEFSEELQVEVEVCDDRSFTLSIKGDQGGAGLPGAELGYWMRTAQLSLSRRFSGIHEYLTSCNSTEDFLKGRCAGGRNLLGNISTGSCGMPTSGPCTIESLLPYFEELGISSSDANTRARHAAIVCAGESGGDPLEINNKCLIGTSADYSIGLFQINLLPSDRCPGAFSSYTLNPPSCVVANQAALDSCVQNLQNPDSNIREMLRISSGGTRWGAWKIMQSRCNLP